ncbi:uncharacterized protein with NAD-binding domain and iron-sulfur cluster [Lewinella marina]|uniref:Amine oxidase domain-containing protein n=1 Tax=Neolewinella marina TaxID=438751 RepID=A0A2G0CKA6_9BACT|nr:NAD(P)-binding protein [Neolewinella marina]NJB84446.1 uncharacterized protein with NAD-binding domain and iron-sulfur cluster [Neolewinella marina]PHL00361.1 hypothetical protein CGL56_04825 [Neolewinella marina]
MRKKIVILGGGMAALSAAHELTDYPGWQDHYSVTLYQMGWRLGGKTATGRGPHGRIEEHGIHILQGWYDTTFRLFRQVYEERARRGLDPGSPLKDLFRDGLVANDTTLLTTEERSDHWTSWPLIFPRTEELPGTAGPLPPWALIRKGMALLLEFVMGSPYGKDANPLERLILAHFFPNYGPAPRGWRGWLTGAMGLLLRSSRKVIPKGYQRLLDAFHEAHADFSDDDYDHHRRLLRSLGDFLEEHDDRLYAGLSAHPRLERIILFLTFGYYLLKGILDDVYDPTTRSFNFDAIDRYDFREWLRRQEAPDYLLNSVVVRFFYTGTFSNLVNDRGGALAAGSALQFLIQSIGYKGSFVYQMRYGTGDTLVMPLYQLLKARGVTFRFFQRVEQVHYSDSGRMERITLQRQVDLVGEDYDPAIVLADGLSAWPATPRYEQLDPEQAQRLLAATIDLEDPWADWQGVGTYTLELGTDFDEVVLGIPVGCLPTICPEIIERVPAWRKMVDRVATTPTQAAQLWMKVTLRQLGFKAYDWGLPLSGGAPNVVVYEDPMYSWLDSSLVLPHEPWPADHCPRFVAYFTGPYLLSEPLPPFTDHGYPVRELAEMGRAFRDYLDRYMAFFWPLAYTDPGVFNAMLLHGPAPTATAEERYAYQYLRVNVRPTDQYTLSLPDTDQYRLRPGGSGFANLFLCGDWTDFGLNVGYIDGAIQSGIQAGQALRKAANLGGHKENWAPVHRPRAADPEMELPVA